MLKLTLEFTQLNVMALGCLTQSEHFHPARIVRARSLAWRPTLSPSYHGQRSIPAFLRWCAELYCTEVSPHILESALGNNFVSSLGQAYMEVLY